MDLTTQLPQALLGVSDPSDEARHRAEAFLKGLPSAVLAEALLKLLMAPVATLPEPTRGPVLTSAAVILRRTLSSGSPTAAFLSFPAEAQRALRAGLLEALGVHLGVQATPGLQAKLCDVIVTVAELSSQEGPSGSPPQRWEELLRWLS
eukprot:RCo045915